MVNFRKSLEWIDGILIGLLPTIALQVYFSNHPETIAPVFFYLPLVLAISVSFTKNRDYRVIVWVIVLLFWIAFLASLVEGVFPLVGHSIPNPILAAIGGLFFGLVCLLALFVLVDGQKYFEKGSKIIILASGWLTLICAIVYFCGAVYFTTPGEIPKAAIHIASISKAAMSVLSIINSIALSWILTRGVDFASRWREIRLRIAARLSGEEIIEEKEEE